MAIRLVCALLSFVMLWSTVGTLELPATGMGGEAALSETPMAGSVADHQIDDQPSSPEPVGQHIGLPPSLLVHRLVATIGRADVPPIAAPAPTPYLEAALRPPIAAL